MSNLIGSAGSKEDLERMINDHFYSNNYKITDDGKIYNKSRDIVLDGFKVVQKRGRWRFELV